MIREGFMQVTITQARMGVNAWQIEPSSDCVHGWHVECFDSSAVAC
jgi:hypothetical protein